MAGYDAIFGVTAEPALKENEEKVVRVPIDKVHDKRGHSFEVRDDIKMAELVESVKRVGVLEPCIVYQLPDGDYEMNAGHRRKRASILAGLSELPVIIREKPQNAMDIEEVDTNIYRGDPSPMEKARAYLKRFKAIGEERKEKEAEKARKRAAGESVEEDVNAGKRTDQILAEEAAESRNQINRYIRLNYLIAPLQELADSKKLPLVAASDLSYLKADEQDIVLEFIQNGRTPSTDKAAKLKEYSKAGTLNRAVFDLVLQEKEKGEKVTLKAKVLKQYFPPEYKQEDMEKIILKLLEKWKTTNFGQ